MFRIDRKKVTAAFDEYVSGYDINNTKIFLKSEHTYHVAENAEIIAKSLFGAQTSIDFAWFLGMLHDIGRFEQVTRFDTFNDSVSVDHAEFGADLLFKEGLIQKFLTADDLENQKYLSLAETSIRLHNKLTLTTGLDEETECFCHLLRDADKTDIFRVLVEIPPEKRTGGFEGIPGQIGARDDVMQYVYQHSCVPRMTKRTTFEAFIAQCCMAFELHFDKTKSLVENQGYLERYLNRVPENDVEEKQIQILKEELEKIFR